MDSIVILAVAFPGENQTKIYSTMDWNLASPFFSTPNFPLHLHTFPWVGMFKSSFIFFEHRRQEED